LWLSAINVQYRDVRHVVPFLTTVWQYATPIAYSTSLIPEKWRLLYAINPMTGVVEGFRWVLLGKETNVIELTWISVVVVIVLLFSGLMYFNRMETTFADVI
jgi:lipopolysaccharide transport system permease protein